MFLETILSLNPDIIRRRDIEDNQSDTISYIETSSYSNFKINQLVDLSQRNKIENSIKFEIIEISKLDDNWNGDGTKKISHQVVNNALEIVGLLGPTILFHLSPENVYPSKFGTIIMDWDFGNQNIFSLEIAKNSVGYFIERLGEPDIQRDCIKFDYVNNNSDIIKNIHSDISRFIA